MLHCQLPFSPHCCPWQIRSQLQRCPSWQTCLPGRSHHSWQSCHLGKFALLAVCRHGDFAALGKFSLSATMLSCHSPLCGEVAFPDNLASLGEGGNHIAFCAGMALFVMLASAQSRCRLQCIVIRCVIILVVLLSVPKPGIIIAMASLLPLPSAGADVPTALPVRAMGMHGHQARPHHCTRCWHCPI
jgi:hypothetical protein